MIMIARKDACTHALIYAMYACMLRCWYAWINTYVSAAKNMQTYIQPSYMHNIHANIHAYSQERAHAEPGSRRAMEAAGHQRCDACRHVGRMHT
jgi:hypothetical protein